MTKTDKPTTHNAGNTSCTPWPLPACWWESLTAPTAEQLSIIQQRLGRTPRGVLGTLGPWPTSHASSGNDVPFNPSVLVGAPWLDEQPMPTLFWLIDPMLTRRIGDLERKGGVQKAETWLKADPLRAQAYTAEHATYAAMRMAWLQAQPHLKLPANMHQQLSQTGIGGIRSSEGIKCLHLQCAWAIAAQHLLQRSSILVPWLRLMQIF